MLERINNNFVGSENEIIEFEHARVKLRDAVLIGLIPNKLDDFLVLIYVKTTPL